jgi:hypothetical protein
MARLGPGEVSAGRKHVPFAASAPRTVWPSQGEGSGTVRRRAIGKWDRISGCILFFIGVVTAWSAVRDLSLGSFQRPGPGFLPFGLACLLSLLSLILVVRSRKGTGRVTAFWPERTWVRPALGSLGLFAYAFLMAVLGFVPTTFLFLVGWTRVMERLPWRTVLGVAACVTGGLYLVFVWFLGVPVPAGFWGR